MFRPKVRDSRSPQHPLVKEVRLIEVKGSRMENLAERGASELFCSRNIKNDFDISVTVHHIYE